jgi:hypothetical protein
MNTLYSFKSARITLTCEMQTQEKDKTENGY